MSMIQRLPWMTTSLLAAVLAALLLPHALLGADDATSRLFAAAQAGRLDQARAAIEAGADVNGRDGMDMLPLHHAAVRGHGELVSLLLESGTPVDATGFRSRDGEAKSTALILASETGQVDVVRRLLAAGADPNHVNGFERTPLFWARKAGKTEVARMLEEAGAVADPDEARRRGSSRTTALSDDPPKVGSDEDSGDGSDGSGDGADSGGDGDSSTSSSGDDGGSSGADSGDDGSSGASSGDDGSSGADSGDDGSSGASSGDDGSSGADSGDDGSSGASSGDDGSSGADSGDDGSSGADSGDDGSSGADSGDDGSSGADSGDDGSSGADSGDDGASGTGSGNDGSSDASGGDDGSSTASSSGDDGPSPRAEPATEPTGDDADAQGDPLPLIRKARELRKNGQGRKALDMLLRLGKLHPRHARLRAELALTWLALGHRDRARRQAMKVRQLDPALGARLEALLARE